MKLEKLFEMRACGSARDWFAHAFGERASTTKVLLKAVDERHSYWVGWYIDHLFEDATPPLKRKVVDQYVSRLNQLTHALVFYSASKEVKDPVLRKGALKALSLLARRSLTRLEADEFNSLFRLGNLNPTSWVIFDVIDDLRLQRIRNQNKQDADQAYWLAAVVETLCGSHIAENRTILKQIFRLVQDLEKDIEAARKQDKKIQKAA